MQLSGAGFGGRWEMVVFNQLERCIWAGKPPKERTIERLISGTSTYDVAECMN
jgi:hypothetical protein